MIKGGYKIVDLKNTSFTVGGGAKIVKGVHEAIESNYRKPILLSGLVIDGVERSDRYVEFFVSEGSYYGYLVISDVGTLTIIISSDDEITINV